MKDPSQAITDAFYSLLNGNITYNGSKVKVFKRPAKNTEVGIQKGKLYFYIEIGEITDTETGQNADVFTHDTTAEIQIIVGFPGVGDKTVLNTIVNSAMQLIQTTKGGKLSLGSDFSNIVFYLENAFETREDGIHKVLIKTLRYRLEIDETS
jgi:hypothetical protein